MTVQADDRRREYTATGLTNTFNGPMAYDADVIQVFTQAAADGSPIVLVDPSDYEVQRVGREGGTRIVLDSTPVAGTKILILRTLPFDQLVDITNQSAFNADVLERGLDLLAMQIQQLDDGSMQLVFDTGNGVFAWDARGFRIVNVGDGIGEMDAANMRTLWEYVEQVLGGGGVVGVTPLVFTFIGDGVITAIPIPGADVAEPSMYDTYIETAAGNGLWIGQRPGIDFGVTVDPLDTANSTMDFAVAPGNLVRGFSVLRGYARPYVGPTPITTVSPEIVFITTDTTINGTYRNKIIEVNEPVNVTITFRENTGDPSLDFKVGDSVGLRQRGAGKIIVAAEGAGTIEPPDDFQNQTRAVGSLIGVTCMDPATSRFMSSNDLLRNAFTPNYEHILLVDRIALSGSNVAAAVLRANFVMPYDFQLRAIADRGCYANLMVAQASGAVLTVDVNVSGVSILSTKLTFDNTEKTTLTASTPAVYDAAFVTANRIIPAGAEVTFDLDSIGTAGARGLSLVLVGQRVA